MSSLAFNVVGFIIPMTVGVMLFVVIGWVVKPSINDPEIVKVFWPVIVLLPMFAYISYSLEPMQLVSKHGVSINYAMLSFVSVYQIQLVVWRFHKFALAISYLMGFIVGVLSDVVGLFTLSGTVVFGGNGIRDADFWSPVIVFLLTVGAVLYVRLYDKHRKKAKFT